MEFRKSIFSTMDIGHTSTNPVIAPMGKAERDWIAERLTEAANLAVSYSLPDRDSPLTPAILDRIYYGWWNSRQRITGNPRRIVNIIGVALGQQLVDRWSLSWVIATDAWGPELALRGQPGGRLIFPVSLIARRFERGETMFIERLFASLSQPALEHGSR